MAGGLAESVLATGTTVRSTPFSPTGEAPSAIDSPFINQLSALAPVQHMAENDQNPPGEAHFDVFEDDNNSEIPLGEQGDPAAPAVPAVPHYVLVQEQLAVVALDMAEWQRKAPGATSKEDFPRALKDGR